MSQAETAVRHYLDYLADPSSIIDKARISQLESELSSTADPITKLHTIAALEKARMADGESVRSGFVAHAHAYASANGIPASAFRQLGVSDIALAEAGFDLGHGRIKGRKSKNAAPRKRAPKVSKESIKSHIMSITGSFTLNDIMDNAGGSIGTVNTVVKELVRSGSVRALGPDADHQGRGRAPIRYSR